MKGRIRRSGGFTLLSSRGATEGFTLIEIIIVLAIIAILAGILAPVLTRYVGDSKIRGAEADCQRIAAAIGLFYSDVGEWPIWFTAKDTTPGAAKYKILRGFGNDPTFASGTGWSAEWTTNNVTDIQDQLIANSRGGLPDTGYPTTGKHAWRGPYLETNPRADPWGSKYVVNVEFLWPGNVSGAKPVFVLSPGPDKEVDTVYNQTGPDLTVSDDDIAFRMK